MEFQKPTEICFRKDHLDLIVSLSLYLIFEQNSLRYRKNKEKEVENEFTIMSLRFGTNCHLQMKFIFLVVVFWYDYHKLSSCFGIVVWGLEPN